MITIDEAKELKNQTIQRRAEARQKAKKEIVENFDRILKSAIMSGNTMKEIVLRENYDLREIYEETAKDYINLGWKVDILDNGFKYRFHIDLD